jgi:hypothetical protein
MPTNCALWPGSEIKTTFAAHENAALFRDLPGAGPQLAPRLCVAFGTLRPLYPDPASLQKFAGLAPVIEKSGSQSWTHWRWGAPKASADNKSWPKRNSGSSVRPIQQTFAVETSRREKARGHPAGAGI